MRKVIVKPIEKIELEFTDGVTKELLFSAKSVAILDEEFGGALKLMMKIQTNPYEVGAKIIYAGMKTCDSNITFEEVESLTIQMPFDIIMEFIREFAKNINKEDVATSKETEELKKTLLKEMFQK